MEKDGIQNKWKWRGDEELWIERYRKEKAG
jgi:hypothetical protein